ncbi:hypothetical protein [Chroococcidiopsis sp. SAG 2025]|uniref:hypothetical protein n=1 Tax=Chroococcidiopsis sp. SAG 2025 TaxID=171389 RepID=UPI0029373C2B|nr:hypothetical protein [Chroococcidiopsis sp. SAG 2025]
MPLTKTSGKPAPTIPVRAGLANDLWFWQSIWVQNLPLLYGRVFQNKLRSEQRSWVNPPLRLPTPVRAGFPKQTSLRTAILGKPAPTILSTLTPHYATSRTRHNSFS